MRLVLAETLTTSSGCDVGGTPSRSSSVTFETASMIAESCSWKSVDLVLVQLEPREAGDVEDFSRV